jgi:hypothetical protein
MGAKSLQLRVMTITFGGASKHSTREEALSPERDQTLSVEVLGVKCPQTHRVVPNVEVEPRVATQTQPKLFYLKSSICSDDQRRLSRASAPMMGWTPPDLFSAS